MEERLKLLLNIVVRSKLSEGIKQVATYSIYPVEICTTELTSAQALMAGLFHCLLHRDPMAVVLISVSGCVPQIQSSYVKVWLRDDFRFHRLDVAKCLSNLAQLVIREGTSMRSPIVSAMTELEKKYGLIGYFSQALVQCAEQGALQKQILQRKASQEKHGNNCSSAMESPSIEPFPEDQVTEDLIADTWSFLDVPVPEDEAIEAIALETQPVNFETDLDNHSICDFHVKTICADVHIIDQDKDSTPSELESDTVHIISEDEAIKSLETQPLNCETDLDNHSNCDFNVRTISEDVHIIDQDKASTPSELESDTVHIISGDEAIEALETQPLNIETDLDNHSDCDFNVRTISAEVHIIDQDKESTPSELESDTVHIISGMDSQEAQDMLWTAAYINDSVKASKALAAGARPSCSNKWGDTPLHLATSRGNLHVASVLISGGAMVNCRTDLDATPLHYAATYGQLECALLLLRYGADRKAKDNNGNTPYQVALKNGHYSLADHLRFGDYN